MHSTDITDWTVTFIDTGLTSTIGERLMRVRAHVEREEIFLANYADTLTDAPLDRQVEEFRGGDAVATMLAVPPVSTHHVVEMDDAGRVTGVRAVSDLMQWENGGYFVLRPQIFEELREGEDLMPHAFDRLLAAGKLTAHRYTGFWRAADTFKDRAELEEMFHKGRCPWMLWDPMRNEAAPGPADRQQPNGSETGRLVPAGAVRPR
jgi:glucose-1-phosphate cytidylyltransferase